MITGLRVFMVMRILNMVVDVGLIAGINARIGPSGRAISMMPENESSEMTPTVL